MARRNGGTPQCVLDAPAAIGAVLENDGDETSAIYHANAALLSTLAAVRKNRSKAESELLHADVAGVITALATGLGGQPAPRPPGYGGGRPSGRDLRDVFSTTFDRWLTRLRAKGGTNGA